MLIDPRPYQSDLIAAGRVSFAQHRRVLMVAPTGSGKTVVFVMITTGAVAKGKRVIIVAHRVEIVDQISRALDGMGVRHGRIQPGHVMTNDPVQVAMIQTLARRLDKVPEPDLLVVDEAHHGVAGTWATVTGAWQRAKILGVTATPERLDGKGLRDAFDEMIVGPSMRDLITAGYLSGYTYLAPPQQVDLTGIRTQAGDFAVNELAAAMDKATVTGDAVAHYRQHLGGRPAIAFCVTVEHAEHVAAQFRAGGYAAASVDGAMNRADRADRLASIGDGRLNVLTSCEIISEGVDVPVIAGAILLRPTKSLGMFLQQIGRVLRVKPDGGSAVILDHVGAVHRHGMPDAERQWSLNGRKKRDAAPPVQQCGVCYRVFSVAPEWRDNAVCGEPEWRAVGDGKACVLEPAEPETGLRESPEVVEGSLVAITATAEWSQGVDIAAAKGDQWKRLLRLADTPEKLRDIARARGYKPAWIHFVLKQRMDWKRQRDDATVPFSVPAAVPQRPVWATEPRATVFDEVLSA